MTLPLTDRTRYMTGLQQCDMKRYLQFHAGPYGYGLQRRTTQIPLATGTYVHAALAAILDEVKATDKIPSKTSIRLILSIQLSLYKREIAAASFSGVPPSELDGVVAEQFALVKGLVWAWARVVLPSLLDEFTVFAVEQEYVLILGCSCTKKGKTEEIADTTTWHEEFCKGVRQMSRPDLVLRSRATGQLSVHDFKTTSYVNDQWTEEYRDSVQMAIGTVAVEDAVTEAVESYYIHPLIKGQRKNDYDSDTREYTGPKRQASLFCYLYYRAANPPLYEEDFQPKWKFTDTGGKGHTLGRAYEKTPVWEVVFPGKPKDQDNSEWWVSLIPEAVLQEAFALIGPYERNTTLIGQYSLSMPAEESRWLDLLWELWPIEAKHGWASRVFQTALSEAVPRSYDCWQYGARCSFYDICIARVDKAWEDPLASGKYLPRRPHHAIELEEMQSRGIPVPETVEVEEVA